jgi:RND family efflux transporter MFP subunit
MTLPHLPRKAWIAAGAVAALMILLLYLQGTIGGHQVAPGTVATEAGPVSAQTVRAERREITDFVDWSGTVTSRSVANVAPKVMARVIEMRVSAGAPVAAGDVLAVLDDREVRARAEQARAALAAATAQANQAEADLRRAQTLFQKQATTRQDLDAMEARARATRAQVAQARDALAEADVLLGETTVRAPFAGIVAQRLADPGDMAAPGHPLVIIHDPAALRLEAHVAERCAGSLSVGSAAVVHLDTPARDLTVRLDEVAPMADPVSRTVLAKAALPAAPDLRPGIFGVLRIPCGSHSAIVIPASAVARTGQLETVRVLSNGGSRVRHVRTGKPVGDLVEVLSGLGEGESVVLPSEGAEQ